MRRVPLPLTAGLLAVALAALALAQKGRRDASTTTDEPVHVAAAREARFGPGVVSNLEHPVLMKLLAGAGLAARPPATLGEETRDARRLFPWLFAGLVLAAGLWGGRRTGTWGGLAAAALVAADPTLRGHAPLVHTDVLLALWLVLAGLLLDSVPRAGWRCAALVAAAGAAYGLGIASKYSALPFLAVFLGVAFVRLLPGRRAARPRRKRTAEPAPPRFRPALLLCVLLAAVALSTAALVQQAALAGTSREALREAVWRQFGGERPIAGQEEAMRWEARLPKGPAAYAAGLLFVRASSSPGTRFNYLFGRVSGEGFLLYFPVALAVKLPAALVLGLVAAIGLGLARGGRARLRAALRRAFVPGALALAYLLLAMSADVNIGVRHVLPVVPLGIVAALAFLRPLVRPRRLAGALLALVVAGSALEAGARLGREIPFGNLLVGGPGPGLRRVLSDSNVDWGEAQAKLLARVGRGDLGRVGVYALALNQDDAGAAGIRLLDDAREIAGVDTVVFSVHLHDLARALPADREEWPKTRWLKEWLLPVMAEVDRRKVAVEPLADEYLVYRLGP